jgi:hypothetical protein
MIIEGGFGQELLIGFGTVEGDGSGQYGQVGGYRGCGEEE